MTRYGYSLTAPLGNHETGMFHQTLTSEHWHHDMHRVSPTQVSVTSTSQKAQKFVGYGREATKAVVRTSWRVSDDGKAPELHDRQSVGTQISGRDLLQKNARQQGDPPGEALIRAAVDDMTTHRAVECFAADRLYWQHARELRKYATTILAQHVDDMVEARLKVARSGVIEALWSLQTVSSQHFSTLSTQSLANLDKQAASQEVAFVTARDVLKLTIGRYVDIDDLADDLMREYIARAKDATGSDALADSASAFARGVMTFLESRLSQSLRRAEG